MTRPRRVPWEALAQEALDARKRAYAPYSRFKVGAALLTVDGTLLTGCNVENASYGLCLCAERAAIARAVAAGYREFAALAIASSSDPPASPCGMCRQVLGEFCVELEILLVNTNGTRERVRLSQLLPRPFRWKGAGA